MKHTVTSGGIELAYEISGDGPPLALVHGITEDHRSWDPLIGPLAQTHSVIAVDLRGHGESGFGLAYDLASMANDLHHVLTLEHANDALLVGHSLGGTVVSAYAAVFETLAVVNIDQPLALANFQAGLKQVEPMLRGDEAGFRSVIDMVFDSMRGSLPEPEVARIEAIRRPVQDVVLGGWSALLDSTLEDLEALVSATFGRITAPYLAIHGIDPGPGYGDWLKSLVSSSDCEVWPDLGHYPHLTAPDRFLARLAEFENGLTD